MIFEKIIGYQKVDFPASLIWLNLNENIYKKKPPFVLIFFSRRYVTDVQTIADKFQCERFAIFSPESEGERSERTVARIIKRFCIKIPVAIDIDRTLASSLLISKLPALVMTDENSNVIGKIQGAEEIFNYFIRFGRAKTEGCHTESPEIDWEKEKWEENEEEQDEEKKEKNTTDDPGSVSGDFELLQYEKKFYKGLYFPTKIAYHKESRLIAISNSGRKEVLMLNSFYELLYIIGGKGESDGKDKGKGNRENQTDGVFKDIKFEHPEGLCFSEDGRFLLVCDYLGHRIKVIDLERKDVPVEIDLPFPKSISYGGDSFVVVSHVGKVFKISKDVLQGECPEIQEVRGELDFPYYALYRDGKIIVADSGTDSIKEISEGRTKVLAGGNGSGHKDGPAGKSLFQSPSALEVYKDVIFIADMLNNAIRVLFQNTVSTITITNKRLFEPEDVKIIKGSIVICDTGNHRILYVDPMSPRAEELKIEIV